MITATHLTTEPFAPQLLPAAAPLTCSQDQPSPVDVRPFGLSRVTPLHGDEGALSLNGVTYDPQQQVNVTPDGRPLAATTQGAVLAATHQNTQHDHQWFTDKD